MNLKLSRGLVAGLIATFWLSMLAVAASGEREGRTSDPSPATEPMFKPGDILAVAPQRANLMRE